MAQNDSQLLYVRAGTTYGETAASVIGANALQVFDVTVTPLEASAVERTQVDSQGAGRIVKPAMTALFGKIEFSTYALASGVAGTAPAIDVLFQGCGCTSSIVASTSVTYSLASLNSAVGFVHIDMFWGGDIYKIHNARGTCELTYAAGSLPVYKWTFQGFYSGPSSGAIVAPTYTTAALDRAIDATNTATFNLGTIASPIAMEFTSFSLNLNNTLSNIDNGGGNKRVIISERTPPSASCTVRHIGHSTFNPFALAANETENSLTLVHAPVGSRQTISIPRFTYSAPGNESSNNEIFWTLEMNISRDANTNNSFNLKFD